MKKSIALLACVVITGIGGYFFGAHILYPHKTSDPIKQEGVPDVPSTTSGAPQAPTDSYRGWERGTDANTGILFRYPNKLQTQYISLVDWPPRFQVLEQPFLCTEAGDVVAQGGETSRHIISGRPYCVTRVDEGAAGSVYSQYAYAFPYGDGEVILTLTLRAPNCENYDEPNRSACDAERESFGLDALVDSIAQSIVVPSQPGEATTTDVD